MKKHLVLTSMLAIFAATDAMAVKTVGTADAAGYYKPSAESAARLISAGAKDASEYTYKYNGTAADGTSVADIDTNLDTGLVLSNFKYTTDGGGAADLTDGNKDGSMAAYTDTSVAGGTGYENVSVANNTLTAHGSLSSYTYKYTYTDANSVDQTVSGVAYDPSTSAAADITDTVALANQISTTDKLNDGTTLVKDFITAGVDSVSIKNGAVESGSVLFTVVDPDHTDQKYTLVESGGDLKLQKYGTSEDATITTGSNLEKVYNTVKNAYNNSVDAIEAAKTNTGNAYTASAASYGQAENAYIADGNKLNDLTGKYATYEYAVTAYATAGDVTKNTSYKSALDSQSDENASLADAKKVYESDLTNITDANGNSVYATAAQGAKADSVATTIEGYGDVVTHNASEFATAAQGAKADSVAETIEGYGDVVTHDASEFATAAQGAKADTALQSEDIATGTTKGTISVKGNNVAVFGLGSAAYEDTSAFDLAGAAATAESNAKDYTDSVAAGLRSDFAASDARTLLSANAYTDDKVNKLEKDMSGGVAAATALSAVSVGNVERGEVSVGGGYGYFNGQSAMAFGGAMGLSDRWSINAGAGIAQGDKTQFSIRAGTNYKFKLF